MTHVATAGTLAMSAIDFKLTDRYADVPHDPELQIERPLVMDGCVYPYRHIPPAGAPQFADVPALAIAVKSTTQTTADAIKRIPLAPLGGRLL